MAILEGKPKIESFYWLRNFKKILLHFYNKCLTFKNSLIGILVVVHVVKLSINILNPSFNFPFSLCYYFHSFYYHFPIKYGPRCKLCFYLPFFEYAIKHIIFRSFLSKFMVFFLPTYLWSICGENILNNHQGKSVIVKSEI